MGTAAPSLRVKRPGREADNSLSYTAEEKLVLYSYLPICYDILYTARFSVCTLTAGIDVFGPKGDEITGGEACPALHEARDKKRLHYVGCKMCK
jgi:hypothetical protein